MSDSITLNDVIVIEGRVDLPRIGTWVADLELDADDASAVAGAVRLKLRDELELRGTVVHAGTFSGRALVRVVGGAGGLGTVVPAQDYRVAPARIPLLDALALGGETLSPTCDESLLGRYLTSWTRVAGTVGGAVTSLVESLRCAWRMLPDGTVWFGPETWPPSAATDVQLLYDDAKEGRLSLQTEHVLLPGTTLLDRRLSRVVMHIAPSRIEFEAWTEVDAADVPLGDRLGESIARFVRRIMSRVDFHALYAARVVAQNADGTLDVLPDDARMPSKASVPIRSLPGLAIKVAPGARVLLGFENGDPGKPIATLWEADGLVELAFGGGSAPVARMGDQIMVTLPPTVPVVGTVGGNPFTGTMTITTPLTGQIITGAEKVKA